MDIDQARDRYNNDFPFSQLVETLYRFMDTDFTYGDLRDAAFLAKVLIEEDV
jgi:hypothetical protein